MAALGDNGVAHLWERMKEYVKAHAGGNFSAATPTSDGLMSAGDKAKLDGVESGANKYIHPSYTVRESGLYKVTVDSTGHVSSVTKATKEDITALGIPSENTTYGVASSTSNGLMSGTDKAKLDGVESGANKYTHPTYTPKTSGLYKITVDSTGHVSSVVAVTKEDIVALGIPSENTNTNTTYTLTKSGSNIVLTGSDGSSTSVADSDTTYGLATSGSNGLMSAGDKAKLDGLSTSGGVSGTRVTATLSGLSWVSQTDGTYTQAVTVSGVTASNDILITPTTAYRETYKNMCCEAISQAANSVTFKCLNPQDTNVTVEIIIFNF